MPYVIAAIAIPPDVADKCRLYRINRSAVSRAALIKEIARIEKETGATTAKQNAPAVTQGVTHAV